MKFEKEEARQKLLASLTNDGKKPLRMSERTLSEQLETLTALVADDEMELDDFIQKVRPVLECVNSNVEHDVAEYIRQHPAPPAPPVQPSPAPAPAPEEPKHESKDPAIKAMQEEIARMRKEMEAEKKAALVDTKKSAIRKFLKENNVDDDEWVDKAMGLFSVGADEDVEARGKSMLELYNQQRGNVPPGGPKTPSGTQSDVNDMLKEVIKFRKSRVVPR